MVGYHRIQDNRFSVSSPKVVRLFGSHLFGVLSFTFLFISSITRSLNLMKCSSSEFILDPIFFFSSLISLKTERTRQVVRFLTEVGPSLQNEVGPWVCPMGVPHSPAKTRWGHGPSGPPPLTTPLSYLEKSISVWQWTYLFCIAMRHTGLATYNKQWRSLAEVETKVRRVYQPPNVSWNHPK